MVKSDRTISYVLVIPAVALLVFITAYPILYQAYVSITDMNLAFPTQAQMRWTNYLDTLGDGRFWHSVGVLATLVVGSVIPTVVLGTCLAVAAVRVSWSRYIMPVLIPPMVATPVVLAHFFQYLYSADYGLVSYLLHLVGIDLGGRSLISDPRTVLLAIILVDVWEWTPFVLLICWAGLTSIPREIYEAVEMDGASKLATFLQITLPLLKGSLLTAVLFRVVEALRSFVIIWGLTKGGPGTASEVTSVYIYNTAFRFLDLGKAASAAMLLLVIVSLLAWLMVRCGAAETEGSL